MIPRAKLVDLYWRKHQTLKAIGKKYGVSAAAVWKWMLHQNVARRSKSQVRLLESSLAAVDFSITAKEQKFLQTVGAILYWCEGTHREKLGRPVNTVAFTNSNAQMLTIWLRFLREVCQVPKEKIKVRLYLHPYQNVESVKLYWGKTLGVALKQFENVTVTKQRHSKRNRPDYQGTVKIKVHSQALVGQLKTLISAIQEQLVRLPRKASLPELTAVQ